MDLDELRVALRPPELPLPRPRTLAEAARGLAAQGLPRPECVVVHALFADGAFEELAPLFARISSTDSVPHPSNRIALAPLLADALLRDLRD